MFPPTDRSAGRAPRVAGGILHECAVAVNTLATRLD